MRNRTEEPRKERKKSREEERPVPDVYPVIDTDLGRDNVENDLPAADLEDLDG